MERWKKVNAPKFRTMREMREAGQTTGTYISAGCKETDDFAEAVRQELCQGLGEVKILPVGSLGRAALTLVIRIFAANGRKVVAANNIFGGTWAHLKMVVPVYGGKVRYVDDINDHDELRSALEPDTALVVLEITSNPMLVVADLFKVAGVIRECSPNAVIMVDDTVNVGVPDVNGQPFSPLRCEEVDIAVYSCTKHIAGYGDMTGGLLIGRNRELPGPIATKNLLMDAIERVQMLEGAQMRPESAFLLTERFCALGLRQVNACQSAEVFAKALAGTGADVCHPSLESHSTHGNVAKNGLLYGGGLVTLDLGTMEKAAEVGDAWAEAGVVIPSNSFGEKESLAEAVVYCNPQHAALLDSMGIKPGALRVSLGWSGQVFSNIEGQAQEAAEILKKAMAA